jgi:hypothetical protein
MSVIRFLPGRKIQKRVKLEEKRRFNHGDWCTSPTKFYKMVGTSKEEGRI